MTTIEYYLDPCHFDLVTPDGRITEISFIDERNAEAKILIKEISPIFVGFEIEKERVEFNIKSTLAQLGVDGIGKEYEIDKKSRCAEVVIELKAHGVVGQKMLQKLTAGASIGKLFAADERRCVREPFYLSRMFGRSDRYGSPLLSLGGMHGSEHLILDIVEGRTIAYLALQNGRLTYSDDMEGFLSTIAKALVNDIATRRLLRLHQEWDPHARRNSEDDEILLVRTLPLHIRTVFARVVPELLSEGYSHTTASILQPDTSASGDIYELYGNSRREITDIPLEFYTLEPYREHVFFSDRDQLRSTLEDEKAIFDAFETAPQPESLRTATFIVKGQQMKELKESDWIARELRAYDLPGPSQRDRQALIVERFIEQQPASPILKRIDDGFITSQGALFLRHFPSPLMKRALLGYQQQRILKRIYFQKPSLSTDIFFSAEDRYLLHDLEKFGIEVYWVDRTTNRVLKYAEKPGADSGMFVPLEKVATFLKATIFGIYGSNLVMGPFEEILQGILQGILRLKSECNHPLLNNGTPLALVTGGGPGAMELGNKVAKELNILSCANIVDFRAKGSDKIVNEQLQNPYVEAKMTYRLDKLVERQAEFNLDFPILLNGGIGTDFEYSLEEVRRKVGAIKATPILLMGEVDYWRAKVTHRFKQNLKSGTIVGSEWVSNCFYCVQNHEQALQVYRNYFQGKLDIGPKGAVYEEGFVVV